MEHIGVRIHKLRTELDLTLQELGDKVGVGASTVRKWETGSIVAIRSDKIQKLANALRTTPAYLMGWTEDTTEELAGNKMLETFLNSDDVLISGEKTVQLDLSKARKPYEKYLSKEEQELLRIFASLDVKGRMELLTTAFRLEESCKA